MLQTNLLLQKLKRQNKSVNTVDRVMILAFCTFFDGHLSMYQVSFNSLAYFQRHTPDMLFIAKIKKANKSVNTVDRVVILAFCTFFWGGLLSMYQVSINSLVYFQRYAPDKFFIAKIKKGCREIFLEK